LENNAVGDAAFAFGQFRVDGVRRARGELAAARHSRLVANRRRFRSIARHFRQFRRDRLFFLNLFDAHRAERKRPAQTARPELEVELQKSSSLQAENERLTALLNLQQEINYKPLFAQIIGRDTSAWFDTSIINRGSLDGVKLICRLSLTAVWSAE
jgi:hypothetical protein